jgi:hypothetical protein
MKSQFNGPQVFTKAGCMTGCTTCFDVNGDPPPSHAVLVEFYTEKFYAKKLRGIFYSSFDANSLPHTAIMSRSGIDNSQPEPEFVVQPPRDGRRAGGWLLKSCAPPPGLATLAADLPADFQRCRRSLAR